MAEMMLVGSWLIVMEGLSSAAWGLWPVIVAHHLTGFNTHDWRDFIYHDVTTRSHEQRASCLLFSMYRN